MNRPQTNRPTPPRLTVVAWPDAVIEAHGHRPGSPYVEGVWLGVLGPSATWAWQRLARLATSRPGVTIDSVDLATSLGLGDSLGANSAISRTLGRLVAFDVAQRGADIIAVRVALPDLPARRTARLSPSARLAHERLGHFRLPAWPVTEPPATVDHAASPVGVSL
ncbi:MAG: hypothetical protein ACYC1D_15370 [Acidimicrobiales bacterium]